MKIIDSIATMQSADLPRPIVLVPTMGALHQGHLGLVEKAIQLADHRGTVVTSIFVNPTQFGPNEDFDKYPRSPEKDRESLESAGCHVVFAPHAGEMYTADASMIVVESDLSAVMCGASRAGHFSGVCTVVAKLFHLTRADIAVFGQKDYQQLAIIRRMVRDLNFPIQIVGVPTVREADGLAMSSRNVHLSPSERQEAPIIQRTLLAAAQKLRSQKTTRQALEAWMREEISQAANARVDYVVAVDPVTLQPKEPNHESILLAAAVFFGKTRLIDNVLVESIEPPQESLGIHHQHVLEQNHLAKETLDAEIEQSRAKEEETVEKMRTTHEDLIMEYDRLVRTLGREQLEKINPKLREERDRIYTEQLRQKYQRQVDDQQQQQSREHRHR
jgi:pantoate--beta-alanine ligase